MTTIQHRFLEDGPLGSAIPAHVLRQLVGAIVAAITPD